MSIRTIKIDRESDCRVAIEAAVTMMNQGGLIAFPTETVYGVGARADLPDAVERLRTVKSRRAEKAFTVHLGEASDANRFVSDIPPVARRMIRKGWPGPLTIILGENDPSNAPVMSGRNGSVASSMYFDGTIGLRCPSDPIAQTLLRAVEGPVIAASANQAGNPSALSGQDVLRELDGRIDLLVDAGRTKFALPSTIVRVTRAKYEIVREGVYDARFVQKLSTVHVLFLCTGNTCRSPMAVGVAIKLLAEHLGCPRDELISRGYFVESAGTSGGCGGAADNAVRVMSDWGVDISDHFSRMVNVELLQRADFVYCMTRAHLQTVKGMLPSMEGRASLLLEGEDVQDPIGGSVEDYQACARLLERGVRARLPEILA